MTAATPGPSGPNLSMFSSDRSTLYRGNRETFVYSMIGQGLTLALLVYFTSCIIQPPPGIVRSSCNLNVLPIIFWGNRGGGGGNHEPLPASHGNPPTASLGDQIVPPTVIVPQETHKLMVPETVVVAPDVKFPQEGQIGDPLSKFSVPSDGPGGPGGMGQGCCGGIGPSAGPHVGIGPEGFLPAGVRGVTVPQLVYSPEPTFSDEARKSKTQGIVTLMLIVGKDGRPYNIHVRESLGMGLDEKALEAVSHWRFRPATRNGEAVATQIAVEVNFHLY